LIYRKARSLQGIGHIADKTGDFWEAREFFNLARNTFLVGRYKDGAIHCLIELAELSYDSTEYAEAHRQCTQALAECQDLAGEYEKARCQQLLGQIALELGRYSEASEFLTKALESWERQKYMLRVGRVRVHLGHLQFQRRKLETGRSHFNAAITIFSDRGDNPHIAWCLFTFGCREIAVRNFAKALDLLQKAEKFFSTVNSTLNAAECVERIGQVYYYQKEYSSAKAHLTKAKEEFDAVVSVRNLILNAFSLAWVEFREGNIQEAKKILKEAKKWVSEGNGYWQAMYARSLGEFAFHEGDKDGAAVLFAQAQESFEAMGSTSKRMDGSIKKEDSEGWRWFRGGH
jgi:tetratricopeptide (TPR) repeat protein